MYGLKSYDEMGGRTIRTPHTDFSDICGGGNTLLIGFTSRLAAIEHRHRHIPA